MKMKRFKKLLKRILCIRTLNGRVIRAVRFFLPIVPPAVLRRIPVVGRAPLNPEERAIAEELYFHAIKAAVARHKGSVTDKQARSGAKGMTASGERGLTRVQQISRAGGCLVVVAAMGLAVASALISVAVVILFS